jgi:uncharacterized protein (TIGR03435 family)
VKFHGEATIVTKSAVGGILHKAMNMSHLRSAAVFLCALDLWAQRPNTFEVASIRRNLSGDPNTNFGITGGKFTMINGSLKTLIRNAYDIQAFQLAGEPSWIDSERYDITAATGSSETIGEEQFALLLRSLIADRFGLQVHWETREGSVYALTIDKGGPKFNKSVNEGKPNINTRKGSGKGQMIGTRESISILAGNLGNQLGRIVLDKTELTGAYDWMLEWSLDPAIESTEPSLFTAVREQLGLKLTAQKGPIPMLVIDSAQRPSGN